MFKKGIENIAKRPDIRKKISKKKLGHMVSEETRIKISRALKGHRAWNKGLKGWMKEEQKEKIRRAISLNKNGVQTRFSKGEKHPNWKGGITPKNKSRVGEPRWKIIAELVRFRDDYTCIECGKYPSFQVHHIIPWRLSGDDSFLNLITLCRSCHMKLDRELNNDELIKYWEEDLNAY